MYLAFKNYTESKLPHQSYTYMSSLHTIRNTNNIDENTVKISVNLLVTIVFLKSYHHHSSKHSRWWRRVKDDLKTSVAWHSFCLPRRFQDILKKSWWTRNVCGDKIWQCSTICAWTNSAEPNYTLMF